MAIRSYVDLFLSGAYGEFRSAAKAVAFLWASSSAFASAVDVLRGGEA